MIAIGIILTIVTLLTTSLLLASTRYEEGVVGHWGLAAMIFSCVIMLGQIVLADVEYQLLPETLILHLGMALFLIHLCVRHVCWRRLGRRQDEASQGTLAKLCRHF